MMHPSIARELMLSTRKRAAIWIHSWGQSEIGPIAAGFYRRGRLLQKTNPLEDMNNMGWSWAGKIQVKIVDPDRPRVTTPRGKPGVALVRSKSITPGYLGEDEHYLGKWHDGWWNTGDLAYIDSFGRLRFIDRNADSVGEHSLTHLESVLMRQLPSVQELILLPAASGVLQPVIIPSLNEDRRALLEWSKIEFDSSMFNKPTLLSWEQIPLTSTWKIRRRKLMESLGIDAEWMDRRYA